MAAEDLCGDSCPCCLRKYTDVVVSRGHEWWVGGQLTAASETELTFQPDRGDTEKEGRIWRGEVGSAWRHGPEPGVMVNLLKSTG